MKGIMGMVFRVMKWILAMEKEWCIGTATTARDYLNGANHQVASLNEA